MFGRVIGIALGTTLVLPAALVFGFRAYQAYLQWLVGENREGPRRSLLPQAATQQS